MSRTVHPILRDHLATGAWLSTAEVAQVLGFRSPKMVHPFAGLLGARKFARPGSTARNQHWKWPPQAVAEFAAHPDRYASEAAA